MKECERGEFDRWNTQKKKINFNKKSNFFSEREIRWVSLGKNINSEIFGKGCEFSRPVLIVKKVYGHSCMVLPLTSKSKKGSYYYHFVDTLNNEYCAVLCQIRYLDGFRILDKLGQVSKDEFFAIKNAFKNFL